MLENPNELFPHLLFSSNEVSFLQLIGNASFWLYHVLCVQLQKPITFVMFPVCVIWPVSSWYHGIKSYYSLAISLSNFAHLEILYSWPFKAAITLLLLHWAHYYYLYIAVLFIGRNTKMLESKTDNDPVRKQKFPANLTKENGNKNLGVCLCWFWAFYLMHLCLFTISSILIFLRVKCHVISCWFEQHFSM